MPRARSILPFVALIAACGKCGTSEDSHRPIAVSSAEPPEAPTLPPPAASALRVTVEDGTMTIVGGRSGSPNAVPPGSSLSRELSGALANAEADGLHTLELAAPLDTQRETWGAALGVAKLKGVRRIALVTPEKTWVFTHEARVRARSAVELVVDGSRLSVIRWSYDQKTAGPVVAGAGFTKGIATVCRSHEPCAERIVVRPGKRANVGELIRMVSQAQKVAELTGAKGLPVVRVGLSPKYQSPLWAYGKPELRHLNVRWARIAPELAACYMQAATAKPDLGSVTMTVDINLRADGTTAVSSTPSAEATETVATLHECVGKAAQALPFPMSGTDVTLKTKLRLPLTKPTGAP